MKAILAVIAQLVKLLIDEFERYRKKREAENAQKEYNRVESDPYADLLREFGDPEKTDTEAAMDEKRKANE